MQGSKEAPKHIAAWVARWVVALESEISLGNLLFQMQLPFCYMRAQGWSYTV